MANVMAMRVLKGLSILTALVHRPEVDPAETKRRQLNRDWTLRSCLVFLICWDHSRLGYYTRIFSDRSVILTRSSPILSTRPSHCNFEMFTSPMILGFATRWSVCRTLRLSSFLVVGTRIFKKIILIINKEEGIFKYWLLQCFYL